MISELLAYDFMQRAILAVIAISIFSPIFGAFLNSSSSESDERYLESRVPSWGGCWDFLGTINHLDDPCGCGYCCFSFGIPQGQLQALYGDFNGYPHVNGIGSGSYS